MATTPVIRTPQAQGGTFYTFTSASRDLSKTLNNDNLKFTFSKYVLLNLPDFNSLDFATFGSYNNYMQFDTTDGAIFAGGLSSDRNIDWAQGLQNYVMNLESLILDDANYDNTLKRSVSERVFFKWLKETGAIRFRDANSTSEANPALTTPRFVEEDEKTTGTVQYKKVVQYIGDIDVINNVDKAGDSYTEVYIYVPTQVGKTPVVLFSALEDANYESSMIIQGNGEFDLGRSVSSVHPEGLSFRSFYDVDGQVDWTDADADWMNDPYPQAVTNAYFTEPTTFEDATNADIKKYPADYDNPSGFNGVAYRRSKLDGISVDFNPNDYGTIVNDPTVSTIAQYNSSDYSSNFEFNAVLVYYDLYDVNDQENGVTNLYGILLLDNITPTVEGGYIQRSQKFKPNKVTGENGNSYGFKLNLRFDASLLTSGVSTIVNEYNNFSTGQFTEAVALLQQSVKFFEQQQAKFIDLESKINTYYSSAVDNTARIQTLQAEINALETALQNARLAFSSSTALLDMIAANSKAISDIVSGKINVNLQYNTDVLYDGPGILLDKSVPNKIKVTQKTQAYVIDEAFDKDSNAITATSPLSLNVTSPEVYFRLTDFTNMCRIHTQDTALGDLKIYINDSAAAFKKYQTVKIVFPTTLSIGARNILIYTDALNRKGTGVYGVQVGTIYNADINAKPILEVICSNVDSYTFEIDILR
jgi:hypothetical protein